MAAQSSIPDDVGMEPREETSVSTTSHRSLLTGRLVFRTGIALVLVGMVFLFRYSLEQGWFGPSARLTLGAVVSATLVVGGIVAPRRVYGRLLQGAGVAGAYATAWAAHGSYGMVDETTALVQLALVASVGVGLAWREGSDALSAVCVIGAVAAPILIGGRMPMPAEVGYQLVVVGVAAALYVMRSWWTTLLVAALGTGVALAQHVVLDRGGASLLTAGVAGWWAAAWIVPVVSGRMGRGRGGSRELVGIALFPVSLGALGLLAAIHGTDVVPVVIAAAVLAASHLVAWWTDRAEPVSVLDLGLGLVFLGLAALVWLEASLAVPLYLVAAVALVVVGDRLDDAVAVLVGTLAALGAVLVWVGILAVGADATVAETVSAAATPLTLGGAALVLRPGRRAMAASAAYATATLWVIRHLGDIDTGWSTAGLTVLGLSALVGRRLGGGRVVTVTGVATVAAAVGKLILSDLATADPLLRIGLALGIGLALLGVGYWIGDADVIAPEAPDEKGATTLNAV
jgi:hypothetical protein